MPIDSIHYFVTTSWYQSVYPAITEAPLLSIIIQIPTPISDYIKNSVVGYRNARKSELYEPIYNELGKLDELLPLGGENFSLEWDDQPSSVRRLASQLLKREFNDISSAVDTYNKINRELYEGVKSMIDKQNIHTEWNFPNEIINSSGERTQIVVDDESTNGRTHVSKTIHDVQFIVLFGYPLLNCESADELPRTLSSYAEKHGIEEELNLYRWNSRAPEWYNHLWESKQASESTLWDVIDEYEDQFVAREQQWEFCNKRAKEISTYLEPKLDPITIRALTPIKSLVNRIRYGGELSTSKRPSEIEQSQLSNGSDKEIENLHDEQTEREKERV